MAQDMLNLSIQKTEKAFQSKQRKSHSVHSVEQIVTDSPAMQQLMSSVKKIAPMQTAVLLRGEAGTGKQVIAKAIHAASLVANGPFIKFGCEHINDDTLLTELFGSQHALAAMPGKFHLANGGTLFLTEIAHFPLQIQTRLLQFLSDQSFEPRGAVEPQHSHIRLICASEKDLESLVLTHQFLPELYYRLHVGLLHLPSLRERVEDIPQLVHNFFHRYNSINQTHFKVDSIIFDCIKRCHWPDNVRDLENCLEHAALLNEGDTIQQLPCQQRMCIRQYLDEKISKIETLNDEENHQKVIVGPTLFTSTRSVFTRQLSDTELDKSRLVMALEKCGWVKAKAARQLGITTRQLSYALQKLNIEVKKY